MIADELAAGSSAGNRSRARWAVIILFIGLGIIYISFISRLVKIREELGGLSPAQIGALLLACAIGDVITAPVCGWFLPRLGTRLTARGSSLIAASALFLLAIFSRQGWYYADMAAAFALGCSLSALNISINMAGVEVERREGRALMPLFHAYYCVGTVIATTLSHFTISLGIGFFAQYIAVGIVMAVIMVSAARWLYEFAELERKTEPEKSAAPPPVRVMHKSIDRKLILIGLIVLATTLTEGAGNDWITLGLVESLKISESTALSGLWIFLFFEMLTRFCGSRLIAKFGRFQCLRVSFSLALFGVALYVLTPFAGLAWLAVAFWGAGVALGYPLGISMAAESGENAPFRASVAAAIGTVMNIGAPPAIGFIANTLGIRHALLILILPLLLGFYVVFFSSLTGKKSVAATVN